MTDIENRLHHRVRALLEVRVLPGDGIPADLKLTTIDIGTGGARCASNHAVNEDTLLKMTLTLIGGNQRSPATVDVEARVLRCSEKAGAIESRRFELALEFTRMEAEDRKRLQGYLNSL
jgi:c-di-GMP-binding flagellar brake protein YcgR